MEDKKEKLLGTNINCDDTANAKLPSKYWKIRISYSIHLSQFGEN